MAIERGEFLEKLQQSFSAYYNIYPVEAELDVPLVFTADFLQRDEKYWLSKNITMWANETNEFCYVFSAEFFDRATVSRCIDYALNDGLPRVKPGKDHQYTNVKTLFIASAFDSDALAELKNRRFSKSYHHSLWGYTNLLTGGVNLSTESVTANSAGRDLKKYFRKLFKALNAKAKP